MKAYIARFGQIFAGVAMLATPALADTNIEQSPAGWRLQDYTGGVIEIYYTSSNCSQGSLIFPSTATVDDKNRFWSLVMTAKATGRNVGIFYDASGSCQITSFYEP